MCRVVHTEVPAELVNVLRMPKNGIRLEEQLRPSDQELQKIKCELQVSRNAAFESSIFRFE